MFEEPRANTYFMKKLLKFLLKSIAWLIAIIIFLIVFDLLFNVNYIHGYKTLDKKEINNYLEQLDSTKSDPYHFIADKFDTHNVVFVGEFHWHKQDATFINKLISYLYSTKKIRYFGWEFGAHEFQLQADSVVNAKEFDRKKAISIMRNSYYSWNFEEYLQIFKTIWEINNKCAYEKDRMKFLQLNSVYIEKDFQSKDTSIRFKAYRSGFDIVLPSIIDTAIMAKNEKILIYCGIHHAFTKYKTPLFLFVKPNDLRAGANLFKKYHDKIYMTALGSAVPDKWTFINNLLGKGPGFVFPFSGIFNQLYDTYKKPFAVDANNGIFGDIKDYKSWYAYDKWNGLKLKDWCDGYIVLNSFEEVEPVTLINDWVTNDIELNEIKTTLTPQNASLIKDIPEFKKFIEKEETGRSNIKRWHSIKKFWK